VEKEIELRLQGEFIFVNSTRLRLDLDNYARSPTSSACCGKSGIGAVRIDRGRGSASSCRSSSRCCCRYAAKEVTANKLFELAQKLSDAGVTHIGVEPPLETDEDTEDEERHKGGGEAHLRALGGRHEGGHQLEPHGPHANVRR